MWIVLGVPLAMRLELVQLALVVDGGGLGIWGNDTKDAETTGGISGSLLKTIRISVRTNISYRTCSHFCASILLVIQLGNHYVLPRGTHRQVWWEVVGSASCLYRQRPRRSPNSHEYS